MKTYTYQHLMQNMHKIKFCNFGKISASVTNIGKPWLVSGEITSEIVLIAAHPWLTLFCPVNSQICIAESSQKIIDYLISKNINLAEVTLYLVGGWQHHAISKQQGGWAREFWQRQNVKLNTEHLFKKDCLCLDSGHFNTALTSHMESEWPTDQVDALRTQLAHRAFFYHQNYTDHISEQLREFILQYCISQKIIRHNYHTTHPLRRVEFITNPINPLEETMVVEFADIENVYYPLIGFEKQTQQLFTSLNNCTYLQVHVSNASANPRQLFTPQKSDSSTPSGLGYRHFFKINSL